MCRYRLSYLIEQFVGKLKKDLNQITADFKKLFSLLETQRFIYFYKFYKNYCSNYSILFHELLIVFYNNFKSVKFYYEQFKKKKNI